MRQRRAGGHRDEGLRSEHRKTNDPDDAMNTRLVPDEQRLRNLLDVFPPEKSSSSSSSSSSSDRSGSMGPGGPQRGPHRTTPQRLRDQVSKEDSYLSWRGGVPRFSYPASTTPPSATNSNINSNSNSEEGSLSTTPCDTSFNNLFSAYSPPSSPNNSYRQAPPFEVFAYFNCPAREPQKTVSPRGPPAVQSPAMDGAGDPPSRRGAPRSQVPRHGSTPSLALDAVDEWAAGVVVPAHYRDRTYRNEPHRCASDERMLHGILRGTAYFLWIPYTIAALYVAYCDSFMFDEKEKRLGSAALETNATGLAGVLLQRGGLPPLRRDYPFFYYYVFGEGFDVLHFLWLALPILFFSTFAVILTSWLARIPQDQIPVYLVVLAWSTGFLSFLFWGTDAVHHDKTKEFLTRPPMPSGDADGATPAGTVLSSVLDRSVTGWFSSDPLPAPFLTPQAAVATLLAPQPTQSDAAYVNLRDLSPLDVVSLLVHFGFIRVRDHRLPSPPAWLWLAVSLATGLLSGVLCKVRDRLDQKRRRIKRYKALVHRNASPGTPLTCADGAGCPEALPASGVPPDVETDAARLALEETTAFCPSPPAPAPEATSSPPVSASSSARLTAVLTTTNKTLPTSRNGIAPGDGTPENQQQQQGYFGSPSWGSPVTQTGGAFGHHPLLPRPPSWPVVPPYVTPTTLTPPPVPAGVAVPLSQAESPAPQLSVPTSRRGTPVPQRDRLVIRPRVQRAPAKSRALSLHLSLVIPFCTGQWFSLMIRYGWHGFLLQNLVVTVTLGFIGYSMICFQLLRKHMRRSTREQYGCDTVIRRHQVLPDGQRLQRDEEIVVEMVERRVDYMHFFYRLFATKMGILVLGMVAMHVYVTSWMWTMVQTLYTLNALVSGAGILVELLIYEVM
eukprot:gene6235-4485_t